MLRERLTGNRFEQVPEVDIILGGHDHHYDVKPAALPRAVKFLKKEKEKQRGLKPVKLPFA